MVINTFTTNPTNITSNFMKSKANSVEFAFIFLPITTIKKENKTI